ncbi:MAG: DNA topoisomerase VI subunit B [Planctomycetes bacterium]|nr:DNA topoisomerase VI subunit B [Planctomycetota bacterium]
MGKTLKTKKAESKKSAKAARKSAENGKPAKIKESVPKEVRQEKPPEAIAEKLAKQQREISVSEFFAKNRHLLGFDNPTRALLTSVKEAVDNALDACEEAGILPEVKVHIKELSESRYYVTVEDNGPGVVKEQVPRVFGKLLYGSKFHRLKMNRGQQGIGISAVCLYSQLTTGKSFKVTSKTEGAKKAYFFEIMIDTGRNEPIVSKQDSIEWDKKSGVKVEFEVEGRYLKGEKGVDEYLRIVSLANPHVAVHYITPAKEKFHYTRLLKEMPVVPKEIKPHPYGVELGNLGKIIKESPARNIKGVLMHEFSRVSEKVASEVLATAGVDSRIKPGKIEFINIEKIFNAFHKVKIMAPPTNCITPIGEEKLVKAMENFAKGEYITAKTRQPAVYRGNPFIIEAAVNYMIPDYPQDEQIKVYRLANRVPLLYQPGACAITKAIQDVDWRGYGVSQSKDQIPYGPMAVIVHIASVWVPFTSEAKEAIAHYSEIIKEIKLALQECGRQLSIFINKKRRLMYQQQRRSIFQRYIPEVARALSVLAKTKKEPIEKKLFSMSKSVTEFEEKQEKEQQTQIEQKKVEKAEKEGENE